jgi:hypothetical protein
VALPFARTAAPAQPSARFAPAISTVAEDEPLAFVAPSQLKHASAAPDLAASSVAEPLRALLAGYGAPSASAGGQLEQLGMVELAERLGRSMLRRKRDQVAQPSAVAGPKAAPCPTAPSVEFVPVSPSPAKQTGGGQFPADLPRAFDQPPTNFAPPPPVIPAALRPLALEEFAEAEDEDEFAASFSMPLAGSAHAAPDFSLPATPIDETGEDESELEAEEDSAATGYSSLLAMKNPFRGPAEFVRVELPEPEAGAIEPAVVFPGHSAPQPNGAASAPQQFAAQPAASGSASRQFDAPGEAAEQAARRKSQADPNETERALRSALATLQRMSGAA